MSKVIDLNKHIDKYKYWSNSLGETHHWGEYDITPEELPKELKRVYDELYYKDRSGVSQYLAEYDGEYGISLEADYDIDYANDMCISYDELIKAAMIKADLIATKFPQYKVFFGKDFYKWSDDSKESVLGIFMPWNTSIEDYKMVGTVVECVVY
jgi:hypothetical protein